MVDLTLTLTPILTLTLALTPALTPILTPTRTLEGECMWWEGRDPGSDPILKLDPDCDPTNSNPRRRVHVLVGGGPWP